MEWKIKFRRPWQSLFALLSIVFWLFFFSVYFLIKNGNTALLSSTGGILISTIGLESIDRNFHFWLGGFFLSVAFTCWLIISGFNFMTNRRSLAGTIDELLEKIPACTDEEIINFSAQLGIRVTPEVVVIPKEILANAAIETLAYTLSALLYLSYSEIANLTRRGHYTAFHQLADLLLNHWDNEKIKEFIVCLGQQKEYLARALDAAWQRRDLERQVASLERQIEECRQLESEAEKNLPVVGQLSVHFGHYDDLHRGRSALVKWFVKWFKAKFVRAKSSSVS